MNLTVHPDGLAPGQVVSFIQGVMAVARAKADNPIVVNQALFGFVSSTSMNQVLRFTVLKVD